MYKGVAGKWTVFAFGAPAHATLAGLPVTGDAANITANIRLNGGAANAVDDTNPTELEGGAYVFDITATESNADMLSLHPVSATANVQVIGVPGAIYTTQPNPLATVAGSVNDASATASSFITNLGSSVNDFYKDSLLVFTEPGLGLLGQVRPITSYNGTTKAVTFDEPFTSAPTNGEDFSIISIHTHPISDIQAGLATQTSVNDLPTNAELATALAAADDAVLAAIAALNNINSAAVQAAAQAALVAFGAATEANVDEVGTAVLDVPTNAELATALSGLATQTSVNDLPTNAELTAALAAADDAVLALVTLVKAKTDLIPASPAAVGDIPSATANATGLLDLADSIEAGLTLRNALRLIAAATAGKVSGAETTSVVFRNAVADSKNRITATVDATGNRSSIVTDLT